MSDHSPSTDERASLAQPSQSSSTLECTSHLGSSLAVGHQLAQTLDGLWPYVDMEVLDVLDHHLRGCGSWGRRQFRHDGRHLRLDAGLGGPVPDGLAATQIDQPVTPNSVMTLRLAARSWMSLSCSMSGRARTGNLCLGTKELVQERVGNFLAALTSRKEEVKRRCRTVLQSRAERLLQDSQPHRQP